MTKPEELLRKAIQHHKAGRLEEARKAYDELGMAAKTNPKAAS